MASARSTAEASLTRVGLGGQMVRWSVVASVLLLALAVGRVAPLVGVVLVLVALDAAVWWFGADSRDPDERRLPGMPE
jgi:hypothetical protein